MPDLRIRPSATLVIATYILALAFAGGIAWLGKDAHSKVWMIAFLVPGFMLLSAASRHLRTRFTILEVVGDRLKYETGMFGKTTRSIPLHKVQDVTVRQSFWQRLMGLGDLSIETAGETSRLTIQEIRGPRSVAGQLLDKVAHPGQPNNE
ncbi:MAG: hypothetical protein IANPNBLG_01833 [Bryobacteraceae bacterium]|nr:hypothetical protein [Bryobacteraceae bacterium]